MKADTKNDVCADLMRLAMAGDSRAYSKLLAESARILRPYISKRLNNKQDIEDVVQEILLSIHKARHTYDSNRPYSPWLYAIAHFRLQDFLRKHYNDNLRFAEELNEEKLGGAENNLADNVTESQFDYESVVNEINNLSGKQPMILHLMHFEGHTAKEVGKKIGMNESAVKVAAHRAYKILKKKINGQ